MLRTTRNLCLGIMAAALTLAAASEPILGTWKLNTSKSKYTPGPGPKSSTVVYSQDGDWLVLKTESVNAQEKAVSYTNRYKRDGKEYPYETPASGPAKITVKKIDDHHFEAVIKSDDGGHATTRTVISKDGKTRTQTVTGVNGKGEKMNNVIVYDRQ